MKAFISLPQDLHPSTRKPMTTRLNKNCTAVTSLATLISRFTIVLHRPRGHFVCSRLILSAMTKAQASCIWHRLSVRTTTVFVVLTVSTSSIHSTTEGRFIASRVSSELANLYVKDADKVIIASLKKRGRIVRHDTIVHRYPFCERTDTPLIYRAVPAWYVAVEKFRDPSLCPQRKH